jgi:hypothetical protein
MGSTQDCNARARMEQAIEGAPDWKHARLQALKHAGERRRAQQTHADLMVLGEELDTIAETIEGMEPDDRRQIEYLAYLRGDGIDPRD